MNNSIRCLRRALNLIGVKSTKRHLTEQLESNEFYPSLHSMSATLDNYKVKNLKIKIEVNTVTELPVPFIAQLYNNGKPQSFHVIKSIDNERLSFYDSDDRLQEISLDELHQFWSGKCLLFEKTSQSMEPGIRASLYKRNFGRFLNLLLGASFLTSIIFSLVSITTSISTGFLITLGLYVILKVSGLISSLAIVFSEAGRLPESLRELCVKGEDEFDCEQVINSKYSKIAYGSISLSSLAVSYFLASVLLLIGSNFSGRSIELLTYLSLLTIPVIALSLYYQLFMIRRLCTYCLTIVGLLLLEIIVALNLATFGFNIPYKELSLFFLYFLISLLTLNFLEPIIRDNKRLAGLIKKNRRFKSNESIFSHLLQSTREIDYASGLGLKFNGGNNKYEVLVISNPNCEPCAKTHQIVDTLFSKGKIQLQMVFLTSDSNAEIVSHFYSLFKSDKKLALEAIRHWFKIKDKNYSRWKQKFPVVHQHDTLNCEQVEAMNLWCSSNQINTTPKVFVNYHELPSEYEIEDLLVLMS